MYKPEVTCSYCLADDEHTLADCPDLETDLRLVLFSREWCR